jgi:hypothetical protein
MPLRKEIGIGRNILLLLEQWISQSTLCFALYLPLLESSASASLCDLILPGVTFDSEGFGACL